MLSKITIGFKVYREDARMVAYALRDIGFLLNRYNPVVRETYAACPDCGSSCTEEREPDLWVCRYCHSTVLVEVDGK
jgi:DNA-directed RNA polymerase subunit RPC12/RpoP